LLAIIILSFSILGLWLGVVSSATPPTQRTFEIKAREFAYEPGKIVVNLGDTVTFKIESKDVTHGFFIDGYGVDEKVSFGKEKTFTVVADKPGKFKIRCSVTCGPLHPFMIGELVVEVNGVNMLFLGSLSIIVLVGASAFILTARRLG